MKVCVTSAFIVIALALLVCAAEYFILSMKGSR